MPQELTIGRGPEPFTLPLKLVTSTQAILARKRSGKSYTASVQAEELLAAKQQVGVFDPTGAWWGLRSSADGSSAGFPVVVFGGDHGDAPLDFRAGRAMCTAFVEHGFSAVFDVSNLATDEQIQFVMDFTSELLRVNRNAVHIFMDEADTYAPQKPLGLLQNKCLGTVSRLVKQGGIRGVGFTMITQRPASMNKDVLSQVDILTVLRMSHPLDIKAVTDWISSEVSVEFAATVKAALPRMAVGTAFFCSASLDIGEQVQVRQRITFNSGATPEPGQRPVEPKVLAPIDIEKLGKEISASVQRQREQSPEYLKEQVRELQEQIAKGGTSDMGFIEEAQAAQAELEDLRTQVSQIPDLQQSISDMEARIARAAALLDQASELLSGSRPQAVMPIAAPVALPVQRPEAARPRSVESVTVGDISINEPRQAILDAMATLHSIRGAVVTIDWIACTAGTTARSRGFEENMRVLRKAGLVDGARLTPAGAALAHASSTPATFRDVLNRLSASISDPQTTILRTLKGTPLSAEKLASLLGTTERARGFEENIRQLKKRELVTGSAGQLRLIPWLETLR